MPFKKVNEKEEINKRLESDVELKVVYEHAQHEYGVIKQNGKIIIKNSTRVALMEAQDAFRGEAEQLGLHSEQDVVGMVKQIRKDLQEEKNTDNG